jgi:hypothetical protein
MFHIRKDLTIEVLFLCTKKGAISPKWGKNAPKKVQIDRLLLYL